jgi:hypothetical protein
MSTYSKHMYIQIILINTEKKTHFYGSENSLFMCDISHKAIFLNRIKLKIL